MSFFPVDRSICSRSASRLPHLPLTLFPPSSSSFPSLHFSLIRNKCNRPKTPFLSISDHRQHVHWLLMSVSLHAQVLVFSLSCLISQRCGSTTARGKENRNTATRGTFPMLSEELNSCNCIIRWNYWDPCRPLFTHVCTVVCSPWQTRVCLSAVSLRRLFNYTGVDLLPVCFFH